VVNLNTTERQVRLRSLDLARGMAVLFMVMVHVLIKYGNYAANNTPVGKVIQVLGGPPAAPVLMFLMGVSLSFSKRATLARSLKRGGKLFLLAYLLNCLRGTLPAFIGLNLGVITPGDILPYTPRLLFGVVDILQLAGLALIILALIRRLMPWPLAWLILAAAVAVGSPPLWGRMSGWPPLDGLLTLLWGTGDFVAFPLFPWLSYPLSGMAFGVWLASSTDQDALFRRAAGFGLALLLLGALIISTNPAFQFGDYYRAGPGAAAAMTGFVLMWLAACHWLVKHIPANSLFNLFYEWSARVTSFYCIHWIIIGWGVGLVGYQNQEIRVLILLMIVVAVLTDQTTRLWMRLGRRLALAAGTLGTA